MKEKMTIAVSIKDVASSIDEEKLYPLVRECFYHNKDMYQWLAKNFDLLQVLEAFGFTDVLEQFHESQMLKYISDETINEEFVKRSPLAKAML